jgi:hypothetical protein
MEYMNVIMKRETLMLNSEYVFCSKDIARQVRSKQGLCQRKLKVRGNFLRTLQSSDSTMRWLEILRTIPTEFEEAYVSSSIEGGP